MKPTPRVLTSLLLISAFAASACKGIQPPPQRPLNPPREEVSIRPGINADFLGKDVDMTRWVNTFEGETREIATQKQAIVASMHLRKGEDVADVGAGTGLFLDSLAEAVGVGGKVYALDISPEFVQHLEMRVKDEGLEQVDARLSKERSVDLPPMSLDAAFVCDTYHHFEFPQSMLFSMYKALRPSGKLYVVDFEKIPGESRQWVLDHVRADKRTVTKEIERAGFVFEEEVPIEGLAETYVLRFRRP